MRAALYLKMAQSPVETLICLYLCKYHNLIYLNLITDFNYIFFKRNYENVCLAMWVKRHMDF